MDFYQTISEYYDEIFAAGASEAHFINQFMPSGASILDIGCGTGNKTIHLGDSNARIKAIDLDQGMISRARQYNAKPNILYEAMDMNDIDIAFAGESFDAILCLGNTLVHLLTPEAILKLFRKVNVLLEEKGVLILQILNYDRIISKKIKVLPVIETPNTRFVRRYDWKNNEMRFITELEVKASGKKLVNDIPLYPLIKQELTDLLAEAGLGRVEFFGGFNGEEFTPDSFVTLVLCRKQE